MLEGTAKGGRTLGPTPRALLMCQTTAQLIGGASVTSYRASPLPVLRPLESEATHVVPCPSCASRVTVCVRTERETRLRRAGWLALGIAAVLLVAGLIAFGGQGSGMNGAVVALGFFGGIAATCVGFARWFREDGVVITSAERPSPFMTQGAEHLVGFPTIGGSTFTKRGRARIAP